MSQNVQQNLTNTNPTYTSSDNNMMDKVQCVCHTVMKGNKNDWISWINKSSGPYFCIRI